MHEISIINGVVVTESDGINWVYADDALPNKDGFYLVTAYILGGKIKLVTISNYRVRKGFDLDKNGGKVIAWQELPEPCKD